MPRIGTADQHAVVKRGNFSYCALGAPMPMELTDNVDPSGNVTEPPLAVLEPSRER